MRLSVFAFVLSTAAAVPALAGTVITGEVSKPNIAGKSVLYLEPDRLRLKSPVGVMIFRADQNTLYTLLPADKKFMRMTPEMMKQAAAAIVEKLKQTSVAMVEKLKSLPPEQKAWLTEHLTSAPPEQRAQIEKMMAGEMPQAPKFEFRKAGGTASFGKWTCERVEELRNGQPYAALCVVKLSDLGLTGEALGTFRRFGALAPGLQMAGAASEAMEKVVGYAAYAVHVEVPAEKNQMTIETVEKKPLAADLFEVPADYREESMPVPQ